MALRGSIETFTLQKGALGTLGLALVRLDAGPLVTAVVEIDEGPLQVGARVEGAVVQVPAADLDRTVRRLHFRPVPGAQPRASVASSRTELPR